ncbi:Flp pilus assembly protein CpaB [bacterium M21]|nr:Flp pilus assembly protein CpaB [bacterium M21]
MKNYIVLGISILSGLIAFMLVQRNLDEMRKKLEMDGATIVVAAAKRRIAAGEPLKASDFYGKKILRSKLNQTNGEYDVVTVEKFRQEVERQAPASIINLDPQQPLRWSYLEISDRQRRRTFAGNIATEKRALSLPCDKTSSVSGLIRPNDNIDIIATFQFPQDRKDDTLATATMTLLQNVKVLATGQEYRLGNSNAGKVSRNGFSNITLSVTPKEAEMLIFAQQKGRLHFTLRNPEDQKLDKNTQRVEFKFLKENIERYIKEREQELKSFDTFGR